ncbi:molecular chaperone DnaK [Tuwongella immobilis]|uniref:Chaperone protein DnaK n=1 Tax=Tuwongella immobilis TaxID=692036 RepID=A0A6C2YS59_9BACT|nr:molecular chaperone DnaK [Tuwongella immobilis]VIP04184.1 chaperone protein : Chaperone protein DnaK OS=Singulisphaera acidiphila (strain ATCC BAA-1392 / DSM 18658 / VKM B-2454 / MOB10) GN=dnaK PE=2 SV=1: HSP70 [Tuwongella immobilis]VTS05732.1 chaperone protein : Chaperone protein DnaK OS=Singulisphaera acidiphila (strain ATCC BAA-1392 / DSM 18658 / VKM B-2454 / MOB10) GN=dnaK PE=2 SV=1: HSP70 [Tuwongella immobilis]
MAEEKIIGIDLGTTNSVVAVMEGGEVKVIANQDGNRITPSVVAFTDKGERLVGDPAKRQAITNPTRTIYSIKRFMGRRHEEVESEEKLVPYKIVGGRSDLVKVEIDNKTYTPPEISAMILRKLKEAAEAYLGHTVRKAVITVPAYFNDSQRQATIDAAQIAGFDTEWELEDPKTGKKSKQRMRIINEPTAASLAYALDKKKDQKIAVFDLGGGTFDISVLDVGEDGVFQVKATNGDTHLGGDDFDQVVIDYIADEFKKEHGIDLRKDQMALQRLKEAGERAKKDLSQQATTDINLPFITADASGPKHLMMSITRSKFEQIVSHLIERCKKPVMSALNDAGYRPSDIDEVVMVGGMTRMPRIQQLVKEIFGKEGHRGVNPDEVVAIGAAIQGAQLLLGSKSELLLLDVTPLSLGIETLGGVMTTLISRNTTIPKRASEKFTTASDNQPSVGVMVFQGERPMARDNKLIGDFQLDGIPPAPRGVPQIEVTFDIDANGILNVSAKDLGTGKEKNIRIENSSGLSAEEVERMKRDADEHAAEDKKKRELIDERNRGEQLIYQLEKLMKENGDNINASDKAPIDSAIEKLKQAMSRDDVAAIRTAISELETASQAMAQHLYSKGGAAGAAPGGDAPSGKPAGGKDDVIDAEFEVK